MLGKAAIALFLMFTLNCGINYHRLAFSERAGFEIRESTVEELTALCEQLAGEAGSWLVDFVLSAAAGHLQSFYGRGQL